MKTTVTYACGHKIEKVWDGRSKYSRPMPISKSECGSCRKKIAAARISELSGEECRKALEKLLNGRYDLVLEITK